MKHAKVTNECCLTQRDIDKLFGVVKRVMARAEPDELQLDFTDGTTLLVTVRDARLRARVIANPEGGNYL